jgi:CRP/FNR family transcriptional regulator, cyclic AMP receptor protein
VLTFASRGVMTVPTPERDDILSLYRPDILPVRTPQEAGAGDVPAARSVDAKAEHLRRVPLFAECTDQEVARIAAIARTLETPAGTVVTEMGGPGDSFFFIIDGQVSVQTAAGVGDPLRPGDFFGEMSLLDGEPRSATVAATTDLRLLVIDGPHFWRLLNETPDLVRRIFKVLSRRVRRLEQAARATAQRTNAT